MLPLTVSDDSAINSSIEPTVESLPAHSGRPTIQQGHDDNERDDEKEKNVV
jgi:hypothetical protein